MASSFSAGSWNFRDRWNIFGSSVPQMMYRWPCDSHARRALGPPAVFSLQTMSPAAVAMPEDTFQPLRSF